MRIPPRLFTTASAGLLLLGGLAVATGPTAAAATNTIVSLTFDDGTSSHPWVGTTLQNYGMRGTFYINSAQVGTSSYYMDWTQIHTLANNGHEIGGHTLHHTNLTTVSQSTMQTEVCDDRQNLVNQGFSPLNSFAYPEAGVNSTAESVVKGCGYVTGRGVGNSTGFPETIPPRDPYWLSTADGIDSSTTLAQLESAVTTAEGNGGGWVIYAFHGVCDNSCTATNTVTTSLFTSFLAWLQPRSANGTVVKTVNQAMTGATSTPPPPPSGPPTTTIACNGSACSSNWYKPAVTITLTPSTTSGTTTKYSTNGGGTWTTYSGPFTLSSTATVQFSSTNSGGTEATKSQPVNIDGTAPSVTVTSPTAGATFAKGAAITMTSNPSDTGGSGVASVTYYYDGKSVGTSSTSPYSVSYRTSNGNVIGNHTITATATDKAGNTSPTSAGVTVTASK